MDLVKQIALYKSDGVVILRSVLTPEEIELLREGIDSVIQQPSPRAIVASAQDDPGLFIEDFCRWRDVPSLKRFVLSTKLAEIGAALMESRTATMYHDHILVKEPRTRQRTPWHQDMPYYDVEGQQNVSFWIPVDAVPEESSLELWAGSHRSGQWYMPRTFQTKEAKWFPEGSLPELPDFDAQSPAAQISLRRWAMQPGDAIAFHYLTAHGAPGVPGGDRRRVFSLRLVGDDHRFVRRSWVPSPDLSTVIPREEDRRTTGYPLKGTWFPRLFPAGNVSSSL